MAREQRGVLMVCLGNICRSPIAEAVFRAEVRKRGLQDEWFVDSAATSDWHTGSLADSRARGVLQAQGLAADHRARQLQADDYTCFHVIFGMDDANVDDIKREAPAKSTARVLMLGAFDPQDDSGIRDPYYDSGNDGFLSCLQRCRRAVAAFLNQEQQSS